MLSLIVPTLGNRPKELRRLLDSLDNQTYKKFEVIIVSQDNFDKVDDILEEYNLCYQHIKTNQRGLSNARNIGLKYIVGSIVTFSDDDCWYPTNALGKISNDFESSNSSIICYQIEDPIKKQLYKSYPNKHMEKIGFRGVFNKSSIEIFLNLGKVAREDIVFDINFGLGTAYPSGEENIFLYDLFRKGYSIGYKPYIAVYHEKRSIDSRLNDSTFIGKGPMFRRMFNLPVAIVLIVLFYLKKKRNIKNGKSLMLRVIKETVKYRK
ncbi:MAG TPA: glycosyltransferase family 2 protein [Niallia sp.]|nr:glycosyltransferase family 2 protein [Niallia sp.]